MEDAKVGLRAAVRALADVVSPALDPNNAQAQEQLRLSMDYIEFVIQRLDHFHDRAHFDLHHYLGMARDVQTSLAGTGTSSGERLAAAMRTATDALPVRNACLQTIRDATAALAAAIAETVRDAPGFDDAVRENVERAVRNASTARIEFERAWYQPLGLDHGAGHVRDLREWLIGPATQHDTNAFPPSRESAG